MTCLLSRRAIISYVLTSIVLTAMLCPQLFSRLGLDFWSIPSLQDQLSATEKANEELESEAEWVESRIREKSQMITLLVQDQISFKETLERFYHMNVDSPRMMKIVRNTFSSADDYEGTALTILSHARSRPYSSIQEKRIVLTRLQREFDKIFPPAPR